MKVTIENQMKFLLLKELSECSLKTHFSFCSSIPCNLEGKFCTGTSSINLFQVQLNLWEFLGKNKGRPGQ